MVVIGALAAGDGMQIDILQAHAIDRAGNTASAGSRMKLLKLGPRCEPCASLRLTSGHRVFDV